MQRGGRGIEAHRIHRAYIRDFMSLTNRALKLLLAPALRAFRELIASLPSAEFRRRVVGRVYDRMAHLQRVS